MKEYQKYLKETVYEPDVESDDIALEFAKHIITKHLEMVLENGVKELVDSGDLPEGGPDELVQDILDQLIPKLQNFVAAGRIPIR